MALHGSTNSVCPLQDDRKMVTRCRDMMYWIAILSTQYLIYLKVSSLKLMIHPDLSQNSGREDEILKEVRIRER